MQMNKAKGVTLFETLLVLAIVAAAIMMAVNYTTQRLEQMRLDRTVLQMQQILNAGLAYYVNNGKWPKCTTPSSYPCDFDMDDGSDIQGESYLPHIIIKNPWTGGSYYYTIFDTNNEGSGKFYVYTDVLRSSVAQIAIGRLPMAYLSTGKGTPPNDTGCDSAPYDESCTWVVSTVTLPGQNLNNARSVNFAGIYSSGGCVPVPECPGDPAEVKPQIMVTPVSVNGVFEDPGCDPHDSSCKPAVVPISGYTAYATEKGSDPSKIATCISSTTGPTQTADCQLAADDPIAKEYWRVCLRVTTQSGEIAPQDNDWGKGIGSVLAVTRCSPKQEPSGTPLGTWEQ